MRRNLGGVGARHIQRERWGGVGDPNSEAAGYLFGVLSGAPIQPADAGEYHVVLEGVKRFDRMGVGGGEAIDSAAWRSLRYSAPRWTLAVTVRSSPRVPWSRAAALARPT